MPSLGESKVEINFTYHRQQLQLDFWPDFVEKWDEKAGGKRFKSEILSLTQLWNLYLTGELTEIDRALRTAPRSDEITEGKSRVGRPKKPVPFKDRELPVYPIRARRLPGRYNEDGYLDFRGWLQARDQARKDLFWFGTEVLGGNIYIRRVHQQICDLFVQKNFDGVYKQGFKQIDLANAIRHQNRVPRIWIETGTFKYFASYNSLTEDEIQHILDFPGEYAPDPNEVEKSENYARTMLLLDPRGFGKSVMDGFDCVQWIINCPDIRILIVSGVESLAEQFLVGIKSKFYLPNGHHPSVFHLLFPEYIIRGKGGTSLDPFYAPNRLFEAYDATLDINSIGSSLSGFHYDVIKYDDIVTDENCNNDVQRQKILDKATIAVNLLMPWGWHDVIGTRYFPDDYYGRIIDKYKEDSTDFNVKLHQRAAWYVKKEYEHVAEKSLFDLEEKMVDLTFPEHVTFKDLRKALRASQKSFLCQQLNMPAWGDETTISFERIHLENARSAKTSSEILEIVRNPNSAVFGAIDLARENKQHSDYTALAVGVICQEGALPSFYVQEDSSSEEKQWILIVLDVQYGKWSQQEIINRISKMNLQWPVKFWDGEDVGGLGLFKSTLLNEAVQLTGRRPVIYWRTPELSDHAKRNRIKGLELLLRSGRLFFLTAQWNNPVFDELEKSKGQKSTRFYKDDVPDVLSMLTKRIPALVRMSKKEIEEEAIRREHDYQEQLRRDQRRLIFGEDTGGFTTESLWPQNTNDYRPASEEQSGPMKDISRKFFGGNGLRA